MDILNGRQPFLPRTLPSRRQFLYPALHIYVLANSTIWLRWVCATAWVFIAVDTAGYTGTATSHTYAMQHPVGHGAGQPVVQGELHDIYVSFFANWQVHRPV